MHLAGDVYVFITMISLFILLFHIKNDAAVPKAELDESFGLDDSIESIMRDPIHICG